jgi:hypothetical protein
MKTVNETFSNIRDRILSITSENKQVEFDVQKALILKLFQKIHPVRRPVFLSIDVIERKDNETSE